MKHLKKLNHVNISKYGCRGILFNRTPTLLLNTQCTILIKAPNGKGKSTILSALVWAIYGKNLKGVSEVNTWKQVRPKDYKGTKVQVYFQKTHILIRY